MRLLLVGLKLKERYCASRGKAIVSLEPCAGGGGAEAAAAEEEAAAVEVVEVEEEGGGGGGGEVEGEEAAEVVRPSRSSVAPRAGRSCCYSRLPRL